MATADTRRPRLWLWGAQEKIRQDWKDLHKDPELWFKAGNVLVYFDRCDQSGLNSDSRFDSDFRPGPAFKLPFTPLLKADAHLLLDHCVSFAGPLALGPGPGPLPGQSWDDWWAMQNSSRRIELYLPSSSSLFASALLSSFHGCEGNHDTHDTYGRATASANDHVSYHVAMRNFFAYVVGRPLVGTSLSAAVLILLRTMTALGPLGADPIPSLLRYLQAAGYLDLHDEPSHALTALRLAETARLYPLYVNAFAHCVGMAFPGAGLFTSPDFTLLSPVSRGLIRHARIQADLDLARASTMLSNFLEDDLSEARLGLNISVRSHLDRFRSFLLTFYATRLGYYPPATVDRRLYIFDQDIYRRLRADFEALYTLLVDPTFTPLNSSPPLAQGGICVVQSVHSFDLRYHFPHLRHPLPRLPNVLVPSPDQSFSPNRSSSGIFPLRFSSPDGLLPPPPPSSSSSSPSNLKQKRSSLWSLRRAAAPSSPSLARPDKLRPDQRLAAHASLLHASNLADHELLRNDLVRAYRRFEAESVLSPRTLDRHERLSIVNGRKVRWILIYAAYQVLRQVTEPPPQVRDPDDAPYLLAISTDRLPPWSTDSSSPCTPICHADVRVMPSSDLVDGEALLEPVDSHTADIRPDVDHLALARQGQDHTHPSAPTTGAVAVTLERRPSRSSFRRALSLQGSLSRFRSASMRRAPANGSAEEQPCRRPSSANPVGSAASRRTTFHEIVVHGYGNGTNKVRISRSPPASRSHSTASTSTMSAVSAAFSYGTDATAASSFANSPIQETNPWCHATPVPPGGRRVRHDIISMLPLHASERQETSYRTSSLTLNPLQRPNQTRRSSTTAMSYRPDSWTIVSPSLC